MLTELDRQVIEKTRDSLKEHPGGFQMEAWESCIAGRMSQVVHGEYNHEFICHINRGVNPVHALFSANTWPIDLRDRYYDARIRSVRQLLRAKESPAAVAVEALDRFLAADGDLQKFMTPPPPQMIPAFIPTRVKVAALKTMTSIVVGIVGGGLISAAINWLA